MAEIDQAGPNQDQDEADNLGRRNAGEGPGIRPQGFDEQPAG